MATGVQPSKFINYISQFKKVLVTRNNGVITQTFKIDSSIDDNYYFSIVNSNNQLISLEGRVFRIYGSLIDTKEQMHILFYSDRCTIENGTQMHFKIETYTSQYMSWVKSKRIIDLTIVEVANPDAPEEEQTTQVVLRDEAIAYKRPYIENQTPTEIHQRVILTTNVPLTGAFGSGHDIDLTIGSDGAAFGTGLTQTGDNQLVIGQYNEADATKAFVIGNGEDDSNRSNAFTVDYQGNVEAKSITVDGQDVGDKVNQLENTIEAVSAAIPSVEGFATEQWVQDQGYLTAHQSLDGYATEQWVLNKGYITGVNLDPYATKDQLTAYATKTDLTVSASVLSNQISQLALNIPTKTSDLTNDAGYLTAVPTSYALKTDIPTGNAQLQNTAGYITGYNAGTGISISNGTISLTGEVGKTYYADNNTLQLNNSTNTFSIKSLSSKLNQGANILLTPQSDGSVTINAIGGGGGGTGGATYLAGLGLSLSTVSAEDGIYKFYVNESWLDNKIDTATSGIQNLSAGTGLKIEDNVISLTAQIPSIDGLASEQWVETNFLSAIPSNYATKDYVDSSVSGKADLSSVYTKEEVYTYIETDVKINQATSGKADKSELSDYATESDLQIVSAAIPTSYVQPSEIADMATTGWVDTNFMKVGDVPTDVYTKTEVNSISSNIVEQIPTTVAELTDSSDYAKSADVTTEIAAATGVVTGWVEGKNYLTEIPTSYVQQSELESVSGQLTNAIGAKANTTDVEAEFTATSAWANETFLTEHQSLSSYYTKSEVDSAIGTATNDMATQTWVGEQDFAKYDDIGSVVQSYGYQTASDVTNAISGKADQSTIESLSTALSTAIDTKANSADVYTKSQVYTKGETDTAINTATSGKVNKTDFDTVTGALSSAIDSKTTSGEVKTQIEAYGYQNATDVANAISGKADKTELQSVSGTLNTAIGGVSDRVGAIEADYTTSAQVSSIVTGYDYISAITVINEYQQFEENTKKLTFDTGFGLTQTEDTVRIELDTNYVATVDALSSVSGTLTGQISAVDTKADTNTNSINALTGRVKAIEDDYTTSAYVTGQVNNLATGAVATNTANIGQLSTDLGTVSGSVPTSVYQIATAGSGITISEQGEIALIWNTIPSAVSQLINDVGFVTEAGGGGTGIEYYGGYGISVNGAEISLTATIPTAISDLTNDSSFATSAQVSAIVTGYNYLTGITIEDAYEQTSHVSSLVLTDDFSYYDQLYWNGLLVDNQAGQQNGDYRAKKLVFSNDFSIYFGDEVSEISINSDILSSYATKTELQTTSASIVALIPTVPTNVGAFTNDVGYLTAVPTSYVQRSELTAYAEKSQIPTNTSDLTNDSGFITASDIPAAPSTVYDKLSAGSNITLTKNDQTGVTTIAAAGGGGGGASTISVTVEDRSTEQQVTAPASSVYFSENDFRGDISNNVAQIQWKGIFGLDSNEELIDYEKGIQWSEDFSVGTSEDHFTVSLTNPIPTNVSDLTNDSGYTTSAVVSAIASAYAEQGGGGTTYTAGDYISLANDTIAVTGLPSQIEYISSVVSAIPTGAEQTNQQTISTGFTYDSKLEIAKNTYTPIDGVITLSAFEVPAGSLDSDKVATFEEWVYASGTLTGFAFNGVTLTNELPSEISQTNYYVFTRRILGSGEQYIKFEYKDVDWNNMPLTFKGLDSTNTIALVKNNNPPNITMYYNKNGSGWTYYNVGNVITINQGETVAFSGNNENINTYNNNVHQFKITGMVEAFGNMQSLVNYSENIPSWGFKYLFQNCSGLANISKLVKSKNMTDAGAFIALFEKCTNLSSIPSDFLNYNNGPAKASCYMGMFKRCTKLTSVPALLDTELNTQCYNGMFEGCTSLTSIEVSFTAWNDNAYATGNWVYNVAPTGIFIKPSALPEEYGVNRIPNGWTVVNK